MVRTSFHFLDHPNVQRHRRLTNLRGQSRGFFLLEKGYRCRGKLCSASHVFVELAWKHGPQKRHTRCACVWSPNPQELQGKRRDRPKRQTKRTNKALGSKSG